VIRVKAAFFSITPTPAADEDLGDYLRWHLLDHMPEQYQLPGIVHAMRWIADGDYGEHRLAANSHLEQVGGVVNYLVGDPVQQTHDDFMELGRRLGDMGRFPEHRPSLQVRLLALLRWYAAPRALISAEVVPFRPHRGVLLVVEEPAGDEGAGGDVAGWLQWLHAEHYPSLLETPGVAGAWMYGSTGSWQLHPNFRGGPQYITVVYLDEDPLATTRALAPVVEERWASGVVRPLFAGPLRMMTQWEAWPETSVR
jgi:hypothetical protein